MKSGTYKNFLAGYIEGNRKKQLESIRLLKKYRKSIGMTEGRYVPPEVTEQDILEEVAKGWAKNPRIDEESPPFKKMTPEQRNNYIEWNTFE